MDTSKIKVAIVVDEAGVRHIYEAAAEMNMEILEQFQGGIPEILHQSFGALMKVLVRRYIGGGGIPRETAEILAWIRERHPSYSFHDDLDHLERQLTIDFELPDISDPRV